MENNKSNITLEEVKEKFIEGIEQVSSVIRKSYGPKGANVSIESEFYPYHQIVNDAQSIIQSIYLNDPVERRGLNFLKELSDKASKDSGEGRKTTIIIAEELLKEGIKENMKGMELKEGLDLLLERALENIDKQAQKIELEDISKVAETSSRSKETGKVIGEIYQKIGRQGIIQVEGSGTYETSYDITDGVKFKGSRWISPFLNTIGKQNAEYENPIILITKKKISKVQDIDALVNKSVKDNRPLVIFCDDIDTTIASQLIMTHRVGKIKCLIIKPDILWKNYIFEDFAKCTGATIVSEESAINLGEKLPLDCLGTCQKIITDDEDTILLGISDIKDHIEELRKKWHEGDNDSGLRVNWLNTKSAVLKLGASSESELSYKLLKARDAINACRLALDEGVVKGGGHSLAKCSSIFNNGKIETILSLALIAPYKQLIENNGTEEVAEDVFDSSLVIKNAIRNAISLAGIVLTTEADIRLRELSFEDKQLELLTLKNRPQF